MKNSISSKRNLLSMLLIICSLFLKIYGLNYSESARAKKNLDNFSVVESFFSSSVDQIDIEKMTRKNNRYSFTIVDKEETDDFQKLGKVYLFDKKGELIGDLILYRKDKEYLVYMRKVYMIIR